MSEQQRFLMRGSIQETWDRIAADYDQQRDRESVYISCIKQTIAAIIKSRTGGAVLDAGCGTGMTTLPLTSYFNTIFALDFSLESLKVLKAKPGSDAICTVQADIQKLPFPTGFFDAVLCANTVNHLPRDLQEVAIAELIRVTKPGGRIVVSVHHYSRGKQRRGWIKEGKPGQSGIDYIFRFLPEEIASLLLGASISSAGYYDLKRIPVIGPRIQNLTAKWLGPILARWGFGHMLIAVINK